MKRLQGFTLIELMIAVVVMAILAMIAYPSYLDQVRKSRRSDGIAKMLEIAQRQERYYSRNHSYAGDLTLLGYAADPIASDEGYYNVTTASAGCTVGTVISCFTTTATPTAKGSQNQDSNCASLSVDDRGVKAATDTGGGDSTTLCF